MPGNNHHDAISNDAWIVIAKKYEESVSDLRSLFETPHGAHAAACHASPCI